METVRLENTRIGNEIKAWEQKNSNELTFAEDDYEKTTQEYGDKFKDQSNLQSEMISIIKEQYDKIQEIYRIKSTNLIKAIDQIKGKLSKNETRRNLELSGYMEDLKLLNKKVSFYENYVNKLKHLVEEDAQKMLKRL